MSAARTRPKTAEAQGAGLYEVSRLAEAGEIREAARAAQALVENGQQSFQLWSYVWLGSFAERGLVALADILETASERFQLETAASSERTTFTACDRALTWMLRSLAARIEFHKVRRDGVYTGWLSATSPASVERALEATAVLRTRVRTLDAAARCLASLEAFERTLRDDIAPALRVTNSPEHPQRESEPSVADDSGGEDERAELASSAADTAAPSSSSAAGDVDVPSSSRRPARTTLAPARLLLQRKLEIFTTLTLNAEFEKAGVVARDIEAEIANFDPLRYLPELFLPYYRGLHRHREELAQYLEPSGTHAQRALESCYRMDLEGFVAETELEHDGGEERSDE